MHIKYCVAFSTPKSSVVFLPFAGCAEGRISADVLNAAFVEPPIRTEFRFGFGGTCGKNQRRESLR